jgi:hypothetical protein
MSVFGASPPPSDAVITEVCWGCSRAFIEVYLPAGDVPPFDIGQRVGNAPVKLLHTDVDVASMRQSVGGGELANSCVFLFDCNGCISRDSDTIVALLRRSGNSSAFAFSQLNTSVSTALRMSTSTTFHDFASNSTVLTNSPTPRLDPWNRPWPCALQPASNSEPPPADAGGKSLLDAELSLILGLVGAAVAALILVLVMALYLRRMRRRKQSAITQRNAAYEPRASVSTPVARKHTLATPVAMSTSIAAAPAATAEPRYQSLDPRELQEAPRYEQPDSPLQF